MPLSVCLQDTRRRWDDGQLVTCRATSRAVAASARLSSRRAGRRASISIRATPPAKAGCHLQEKHSIEIIAFNSLKLRLERAEIQPHLDAFFKRVREADVLLVSEVPASKESCLPSASPRSPASSTATGRSGEWCSAAAAQ